MATCEKIIELDKVLLPKFLQPSKKIERYETRRLTAPGENYGSLMLAADITIKDTNTCEENVINAVAKMVPTNEFVQKMFKSPLTFKKELELYRTVVPTLQEFQREQGMEDVLDFFPEFYGGRLGMESDDQFDCNAVILLENLKVSGYVNVERTLGFDLETSKMILRDLAKLHAVPIALKLKKPELFNKKIKPYLNRLLLFSEFDSSVREGLIDKSVMKILVEDSECSKYLPQIERALKHANNCVDNETYEPVEPFATLTHCDFWVNNTLVKFVDNKPVKNKMVDFQITEYDSPAKDLSFFLFVSIQNDVITSKYDELMQEYYQTFTSTLEQLHLEAPFSLEELQDEMGRAVREGTLLQCCMMLNPIFASADAVVSVDDMSRDDIQIHREVTQLHKEKLWMMIKEFLKKKWI